MDQPTIQHRDPQPYAAIVRRVAMQDVGPTLPPLIGQVAAWLGAHGAAPTGAPFFRYLVIDGNEVQIEVGFPTASELPSADGVVTGTLPGARLEIHLTDPQVEPDPTKWTTVLAFKLAES